MYIGIVCIFFIFTFGILKYIGWSTVNPFKGIKNTDFWIWALLTIGLSVFSLLGYQKIQGEQLTKADSILFMSIFVIIVVYIIYPLINKKISFSYILCALCIISVVVAFYSCVTIGLSMIHSDTATTLLLAQKQVDSKSLFPMDWFYVNGDIWVLSPNLIAVFISHIIQNQAMARMVVSVIWVSFSVILLVLFSHKMHEEESWIISVPIILIGFVGTIDMILYQAAYTSALIKLLITVILLQKIMYEKANKITYIVYICFSVLCAMEGTRQLAEFALPLIVTCIVLFYIEHRNEEINDCKKEVFVLIKNILLIAIPNLVGYVIYKYICATHLMVNTSNNSMILVQSYKDVWENILKSIQYIFLIFGYEGGNGVLSILSIRTILGIGICLLCVFVFPILELWKLKDEKKGFIFFFIYGMIHNMVIIFTTVFFPLLEDEAKTRYFLTSVYFCILISAHYIFTYYLNSKKMKSYIVYIVLAVCLLVHDIALYESCNMWEDKFYDKKVISTQLLEHGLKKGYATYWNAYNNVVYSDLKLQIAGVYTNPVIYPREWLVDQRWYDGIDGENVFLLLDELENTEAIQNGIIDLCGESVDTFTIYTKYDGVYYVYVYNHNILM